MIGIMRRRASLRDIPASAATASEDASSETSSGQIMAAKAW
jgi:hypothetical protein